MTARPEHPSLAPPTSDRALGTAFLTIAKDMLAQGGYRAPPPVKPRPVGRVWRPGAESAGGAVPASFSSRHPDLSFAFQDVEARRRGKWFQPSRRYWKGRQQSGLMQRTVETTGEVEWRGVRTVELDPDVTALFEQPVRVSYMLEGKKKNTTPDLYVEYGEVAWFVEFKYGVHAALEENEAKFAARGAALAAAGYGYIVLTERHLTAEPLAANVDRVVRARHQRATAEQARAVLARLSESSGATVAQLVAATGVTPEQLLFLVRHCVIGTDLSAVAWGETTQLRARVRGHASIFDGRLLPEAALLC